MKHSAKEYLDLTEVEKTHRVVDDFRQILLDSVTIIDVRSQTEYARGTVVNTVNLPLLTDTEREAVGIAFKEGGQPVAIDKGLELLTQDHREARLADWVRFVKDNPKTVICCWRGGLRSKIVQSWLAEAGWEIPRIAGGSKALRTYCISILKTAAERNFVVLAGRTGSGKTSIVSHLLPSIDLEGYAQHRGSAFGGDTSTQPSIINFESNIARDLLRYATASPILVEDESRIIGKLAIPETMFKKMTSSPVIVVNVEETKRVEHIYKNYVTGSTEQVMLMSLAKIRKRLGGARYKEVHAKIQHAYSTQNIDDHFAWLQILLRYYYDPMYDYQLARKVDRIVFQGSSDEVVEYLQTKIGLKPH